MPVSRKRLKQAQSQPSTTHGNPFGAHGKEGVDGSSPSEGLKSPAKRHFVLSVLIAGKEGVNVDARSGQLQRFR